MAGRPRAFIRLSGCNLHCVWCDTAYTWNWTGSDFVHERAEKFDPAREMTKLDTADAAARILSDLGEGLVITGGEPLLQTRALIALIDAVNAQEPGVPIEIETNGTILPDPALSQRVSLFVVSPKLAHSGNAAALALREEALRFYALLDHAVFKFVARAPADVAEAAALAEKIKAPRARVLVMPEGVTTGALDRRMPEIAAAARDYGFSVSDRLHIRMFGQNRGV